MLKPSITPNETQSRMIARQYGMFIHFGINTFNNTEWSDGTLPVESYAPAKIDADGMGEKCARLRNEICYPDRKASRRLLHVGSRHNRLLHKPFAEYRPMW